MKEINIYLSDLTEEAKKRISEEYNIDLNSYNWDVFPMATVYVEDNE